jgi:murein DD-endopeptidase MepM/ murein hydrolase activator NlpD
LDHGYGLETLYGHTKAILVKKGQKVRRGDTIALMGSTGRSTGPHVHYEVHVNGTPVDPLSYILEN